MSHWLKLETQILRDIRKEHSELKDADGIKVEVSPSPYEVPLEVRGEVDKAHRRFIIEFKYLQDEPWRLQKSESDVELRVGKYSKRLYRIEISLPVAEIKDMTRRVWARGKVNSALEELTSTHVHGNEWANYRAVESILQKRPDIFAPIERAA